jgi:hypothetical protein
VHTARRAAASITHGADNGPARRQSGHDLGGRRSREIRFLETKDVGDAILGAQHFFHMVKQLPDTDLPVV